MEKAQFFKINNERTDRTAVYSLQLLQSGRGSSNQVLLQRPGSGSQLLVGCRENRREDNAIKSALINSTDTAHVRRAQRCRIEDIGGGGGAFVQRHSSHFFDRSYVA